MTTNLGITKQQMLGRIREALGRSGALSARPTPPAVDDALLRLTPKDADLVKLFTANALGVGMHVEPCTAAIVAETVATVLKTHDAATATLAIDRLPWAAAIRAALTAAEVRELDWRGDREMAAHFEADAAITDVHAALAETGTIICCTDADHARGHSLAVPLHVAIVRRSDIVPDMLDYMARLQGRSPADLPSAVAMITGPSKTADIEGVLITGVHGPGKVCILLVEDA